MFLSPLNWHYAKFTAFEWKSADDDTQKRACSPTRDPRCAHPAAPAPIVEPRRALASEER